MGEAAIIKNMDIKKLQETIKNGNFEWRKHTLVRLAERRISQDLILKVILEGEIIEDYLDDKPFPSCLIFKMVGSEPYHTVVSFDPGFKKAYIIQGSGSFWGVNEKILFAHRNFLAVCFRLRLVRLTKFPHFVRSVLSLTRRKSLQTFAKKFLIVCLQNFSFTIGYEKKTPRPLI